MKYPRPLAVIVLALLTVGCGQESTPPAETKAPAPPKPKWPIPEDPSLAAGVKVFAEVCYRCHFEESEYAPHITDDRAWANNR